MFQDSDQLYEEYIRLPYTAKTFLKNSDNEQTPPYRTPVFISWFVLIRSTLLRRVKIRLDLEQINKMFSQRFLLLLGVLNNILKIEGNRIMENKFFLHDIQDGRYTQKFTLPQRTLSSVFTIVPFVFKSSFPWSDYWFK